ncbi:hypothetical protein [Luteolibacter sp. AS25]|uniref:hypothetical protein n=1 Tax=Luteolibacter sp. AS25 TaxID=3135776 RepID=UPI00398B0A22
MKRLLLSLLLVFLPVAASAQEDMWAPTTKTPTELKIGSDLRKQLFDQLRAQTDGKVKFQGSLKTCRNWAFFSGNTLDLNNKPKVIVKMGEDWGNPDACALWLKTSKGWVLVDFSFGHSDAFYIMWPDQYGAPKDFFRHD